MSEEERPEGLFKGDLDDSFKKASDSGEDQSDNETNVSAEEKLEVKMHNYRFYPDVKISLGNKKSKPEKFPFCLVWTPIPMVTWFFPSIGHVGIGKSDGIIRDYYCNQMVGSTCLAFGDPTKYVKLKMDGREVADYDKAIQKAVTDYEELDYDFFLNNCHSFVARCLNHLKYNGKNNYNMVSVWWMFLLRGRYVNCKRFLKTYCGFFVIVLIIAAIVVPIILFTRK